MPSKFSFFFHYFTLCLDLGSYGLLTSDVAESSGKSWDFGATHCSRLWRSSCSFVGADPPAKVGEFPTLIYLTSVVFSFAWWFYVSFLINPCRWCCLIFVVWFYSFSARVLLYINLSLTPSFFFLYTSINVLWSSKVSWIPFGQSNELNSVRQNFLFGLLLDLSKLMKPGIVLAPSLSTNIAYARDEYEFGVHEPIL